MEDEILIGIAGLVLSALMYFAGVKRTEKRLQKEDKESRIDAVFSRYMDFRRTNKTGGCDGLLKAGVATLESNFEIRELATRIVNHGEKNPINGLDTVDLKILFTYAAKNGINFLRKPVEEIIEESGA